MRRFASLKPMRIIGPHEVAKLAEPYRGRWDDHSAAIIPQIIKDALFKSQSVT